MEDEKRTVKTVFDSYNETRANVERKRQVIFRQMNKKTILKRQRRQKRDKRHLGTSCIISHGKGMVS